MVNDLRVCARPPQPPPRPHTPGDQRKRVTAIYWGSSGRRFKSCQPDAVQRLFLVSGIRSFGGLTHAFDPNEVRAAAETCLLTPFVTLKTGLRPAILDTVLDAADVRKAYRGLDLDR
jgi:hypothetical protein